MNNKQTSKPATTLSFRTLAMATLAPLSLCAPGLQAATVHLSGTYVDIYYDDNQSSLGLLGTPTLSTIGDSLTFAPLAGLEASSKDGIGTHTGTPTDAVNASFTFRAVAHDSNIDLKYVLASQLGSYEISGSGAVSAANIVSVLDTTDIMNNVFADFQSTSDFTIADGNTQNWGGLGRADLTGSNWDNVSDILVTVQNNFAASSNGLSDSAMINGVEGLVISLETALLAIPQLIINPDGTDAPRGVKPWVRSSNTSRVLAEAMQLDSQLTYMPPALSAVGEVPLPASAWLFGSGLIGFVAGGLRRKKRSQ